MSDLKPVALRLQRDVAIADKLIATLRDARSCLSDPSCAAGAQARIEAARRVLVEYGGAPYSRERRCELVVDALDRSERLAGSMETRAQVVRSLLDEAMPRADVSLSTVRDAVALWTEKKQRAARSIAIRELARALDCDARSLMTLLRQARAQRRAASRRK